MTPEQEALADRVRALLDGAGELREVPMFGERAVMLDERMLVCAGSDGRLLVRVEPAREAELLAVPGAARATMRDRDMGAGWIRVDADALASDAALAFWVDAALASRPAT